MVIESSLTGITFFLSSIMNLTKLCEHGCVSLKQLQIIENEEL